MLPGMRRRDSIGEVESTNGRRKLSIDTERLAGTAHYGSYYELDRMSLEVPPAAGT